MSAGNRTYTPDTCAHEALLDTIFNDDRYGGSEILKGNRTAKYQQFVRNCFEICPRQALHAKTLGFVHPITGKEMFFDSELPQAYANFARKWRGYAKQIDISII